MAAAPAGYREDFLEELDAARLESLVALQDLKQEAFNAGATAWIAWNGTTCSTTATTNNLTWQSWNTSTTGNVALYNTTTSTISWVQPNWTSWNTSYEETAEQKAARERARAERLAAEERRCEEQQEAARLRLEAEARAKGLLRSLLSDEQWASYTGRGWFEVTGSSGRRWRIRDRGQSGNVDLMPEIGDERDATLCAHPPGCLPAADAHVAQMLALVTDDEAFERVANVHWRNPARQPPFMRAVA